MEGNKQLAWIPAIQQFSQYLIEYKKRKNEEEQKIATQNLTQKYTTLLDKAENMEQMYKIYSQAVSEGAAYNVNMSPILSSIINMKLQAKNVEYQEKNIKKQEEDEKNKEQVFTNFVNNFPHSNAHNYFYYDGKIVDGKTLYEMLKNDPSNKNVAVFANTLEQIQKSALKRVVEVTGSDNKLKTIISYYNENTQVPIKTEEYDLKIHNGSYYMVDKKGNKTLVDSIIKGEIEQQIQYNQQRTINSLNIQHQEIIIQNAKDAQETIRVNTINGMMQLAKLPFNNLESALKAIGGVKNDIVAKFEFTKNNKTVTKEFRYGDLITDNNINIYKAKEFIDWLYMAYEDKYKYKYDNTKKSLDTHVNNIKDLLDGNFQGLNLVFMPQADGTMRLITPLDMADAIKRMHDLNNEFIKKMDDLNLKKKINQAN